MNISEFIAKWRKADLKERSAAQEHFIDLCRLLDHPTPAEADPKGAAYCFEKDTAKQGGGCGFADVWKKDHFGWEYKGKHKDLDEAYNQLLLYRDALANPPLLVTCDLNRIVVHTNFTGTVSVRHEIALEDMGQPRNMEILRAVFHDPAKLRPGKTSEAITQEVAEQFAGIAESMRKRGLDSAQVAHFLDRVVFCLFAEDIALLPDMIFTRIVDKSEGDPSRFARMLAQLFGAMSKGGEFGTENIRHFNGNLFDDETVLDVTADEMKRIAASAHLDWSAVDPSIFGTLFERGLDPAKRAQLGAHFTGKEEIELLVDAVVMQPLRREWEECRQIIDRVLTTGKKNPSKNVAKPLTPQAKKKAKGEAASLIHKYLVHLQGITVLDPACGSGNFLYVALQRMKDLEKEVIVYCMDKELGSFLPLVGPWQLYGLEINPYAFDLAQMTVWIGWLQWIRFNGFGIRQEPILRPLHGNFQCKDAIIDLTDPDNPKEPKWPKVDYIIGNPPFLGGKMLRRELGDGYVYSVFNLYRNRVPREADLCCYWFEKARAHVEKGGCKRAGLLATQGIRGGANREVLKRIKETGDIFWAISDKEWVLDGANVHVSMIGFDNGAEDVRKLDGSVVGEIAPNLSTAETTSATSLAVNQGISFMGVTPAGAFDISYDQGLEFLSAPNPNGRPSSDVVRPYLNGKDLNQRPRGQWTIDYGSEATAEEAAYYERPFAYVSECVLPERQKNNRQTYREFWWRYAESRPAMRKAFASLDRYLATCMVAKYRLFVWLPTVAVPANVVIVFARSDDYFFGVLHSRAHEVWSLAQGTQLREKESGFRYTPTTCFETFPFPNPTPEQERAIADAAKELNALRENWLNPPEWTKEEILEFPGTPGGPWDRFIAPGTQTVRYPRLVPRDDDCAKRLKDRTLTKLYNERPAWLAHAHAKLDHAVFAAYGWEEDLSSADCVACLLALNLATGAKA